MPVTRVPVDAESRAPSGRTTAHIVTAEGESLLVDPAARSDALDAAVEEHDPTGVAVTHHHPDHVGAVASYAQRKGMTVWARAGRAGAFETATGTAPDRLFRPGGTLPAGVGVVDTPGHAPEHVAFVAGEEWLTGDLAVAAGSVVVGAPEGDMRAY
ncbi:MAG: Zn-dependent hydrolase [halophilic archaeon J07HX64]|nr:MAG: Zn-dependent hydrolase [halophilic archaeon J07HX64]